MDALATFLLDPVVTRAFASTLAIILLAGGWQKLRDPQLFRAAVENYRLLPEPMAAPAAWLLPIVEVLSGVLLLFPETCAAGSLLAVALLLVVTGAVAINLLRGRREIDCGCGGLSSQPLSWVLVARNLVLALFAWPAAQQGMGRSLFLGDYVTLAGAVLALVGLYVCTNQLLSNAPMQLALRK